MCKRTLLVCCKAYNAKDGAFDNIKLRKIPAGRAEKVRMGRDDYSLKIAKVAPSQEPAVVASPEPEAETAQGATADSRHPERDRALFETAYYGGLRVSELATLTWDEIIPRENGEVQLAVIGKDDKPRHILLPAEIAGRLLALREGARAKASVFGIKTREINYLIKRTARRAGVNEAASAHWFRHAHASHAIGNGAPITLVSQTLGHADLKTTSVYAHARPNESSSRFLKKR